MRMGDRGSLWRLKARIQPYFHPLSCALTDPRFPFLPPNAPSDDTEDASLLARFPALLAAYRRVTDSLFCPFDSTAPPSTVSSPSPNASSPLPSPLAFFSLRRNSSSSPTSSSAPAPGSFSRTAVLFRHFLQSEAPRAYSKLRKAQRELEGQLQVLSAHEGDKGGEGQLNEKIKGNGKASREAMALEGEEKEESYASRLSLGPQGWRKGREAGDRTVGDEGVEEEGEEREDLEEAWVRVQAEEAAERRAEKRRGLGRWLDKWKIAWMLWRSKGRYRVKREEGGRRYI